jgi:carboxymethylenebutenolidase
VLAFGLLALAAAASAGAAEQAVTFPSGSEKGSGVLFTPEGQGPFPAVIAIQEWWGLDDWVKSQARELAKQGYVVLAPDLYRGKVTADPTVAHQLMSGLPPDQALRDLKGAYAYLQARPDVNKDKVGAIGWCMGGRYALALATEEPGLDATVAYYGAPPTDEAAIGRIQAAVLGNFGAQDEGPSPAQVKAFEAAMKKAGKSADLKIYEGAGHAFANVNNPWKGYREAQARDAWARTTAFFAKHLKGKA